jgi:hypothetical protein
MNEQTGQYRDFSRGNERLITDLQGLQLRPAEEISQRLTLRDMIRASGQEGARPYYDVTEALVPVMQRLGYTPTEINLVLRGPYAQSLVGRSTTYAANTLREQRGNLGRE